MIISLKHRFVILCNRKCGSTSLVHALPMHSSLILFDGMKLRHQPYRYYRDHVVPMLEAAGCSDLEKMDIFCIFRDPADWLYSWYRFNSREKLRHAEGNLSQSYTGDMSWDDFLTACLDTRPRPLVGRIGRQYPMVEAAPGQVGPIDLWCYQDLPKFVTMLEERIGQPLGVDRMNVSPVGAGAISEADRARISKGLVRDSEIFRSIPRRA